MRGLTLVAAGVLCAWLGLFGTQAATAKITVSPAYAEMPLDKGRATGEFTITNEGDTEERFRINTKHFIFNRDGSIQEVEPDDHSMATWIVFNPKEFTLPANSRQIVRWAILPKGQLRNGEYWCCMKLESLNTSVANMTDKEGRKMNIAISAAWMVPMFGKVGTVAYRGSFKEAGVVAADDGSASVQAVLVNDGNGRLLPRGKYEIADGSGAVAAKGEGLYGYVMPGNERLYKAKLAQPLPAGKYTLRMEFTWSKEMEPLRKEVLFDWVPPPPKAPGAPAAAVSPSAAPTGS